MICDTNHKQNLELIPIETKLIFDFKKFKIMDIGANTIKVMYVHAMIQGVFTKAAHPIKDPGS